jgi:hypothetical protein
MFALANFIVGGVSTQAIEDGAAIEPAKNG